MNKCNGCQVKEDFATKHSESITLLKRNCFICRRNPTYEESMTGDLTDKFTTRREEDEDYPGNLAFSI